MNLHAEPRAQCSVTASTHARACVCIHTTFNHYTPHRVAREARSAGASKAEAEAEAEAWNPGAVAVKKGATGKAGDGTAAVAQVLTHVLSIVWSLMAYTFWSNHTAALLAVGDKRRHVMLATVEVLTYTIIAPVYFLISLLALQLKSTHLDGCRGVLFNTLLSPLAAGAIARAFIARIPGAHDSMQHSCPHPVYVWFYGQAASVLDLDGTSVLRSEYDPALYSGYALVARREYILLFSIVAAEGLVGFGGTTATTPVERGAWAVMANNVSYTGICRSFRALSGALAASCLGMLVFIGFAVVAGAGGDAVAAAGNLAPYVQRNWDSELMDYLLLAYVGVVARHVCNAYARLHRAQARVWTAATVAKAVLAVVVDTAVQVLVALGAGVVGFAALFAVSLCVQLGWKSVLQRITVVSIE